MGQSRKPIQHPALVAPKVVFIIYTPSPSSPSFTGATSIITTISGALPSLCWESQSKLLRLSSFSNHTLSFSFAVSILSPSTFVIATSWRIILA
jgi:hypothetical protein